MWLSGVAAGVPQLRPRGLVVALGALVAPLVAPAALALGAPVERTGVTVPPPRGVVACVTAQRQGTGSTQRDLTRG